MITFKKLILINVIAILLSTCVYADVVFETSIYDNSQHSKLLSSSHVMYSKDFTPHFTSEFGIGWRHMDNVLSIKSRPFTYKGDFYGYDYHLGPSFIYEDIKGNASEKETVYLGYHVGLDFNVSNNVLMSTNLAAFKSINNDNVMMASLSVKWLSSNVRKRDVYNNDDMFNKKVVDTEKVEKNRGQKTIADKLIEIKNLFPLGSSYIDPVALAEFDKEINSNSAGRYCKVNVLNVHSKEGGAEFNLWLSKKRERQILNYFNNKGVEVVKVEYNHDAASNDRFLIINLSCSN